MAHCNHIDRRQREREREREEAQVMQLDIDQRGRIEQCNQVQSLAVAQMTMQLSAKVSSCIHVWRN